MFSYILLKLNLRNENPSLRGGSTHCSCFLSLIWLPLTESRFIIWDSL